MFWSSAVRVVVHTCSGHWRGGSPYDTGWVQRGRGEALQEQPLWMQWGCWLWSPWGQCTQVSICMFCCGSHLNEWCLLKAWVIVPMWMHLNILSGYYRFVMTALFLSQDLYSQYAHPEHSFNMFGTVWLHSFMTCKTEVEQYCFLQLIFIILLSGIKQKCVGLPFGVQFLSRIPPCFVWVGSLTLFLPLLLLACSFEI